ncbi:hypothetical protein B4U84_26715 [Westiellopsis prolifica IICB1]|nr:hypothetical protein B4U84_26715 [Westiellopsis prolifica IICB1]
MVNNNSTTESPLYFGEGIADRINYIMSLRTEKSGMKQSQGLGLLLCFEAAPRLRFARNECKYFCLTTYFCNTTASI